ncbi:hypothetical protein B566_EDAN010446 [Ephemera danica]|nr:hypothetical protein B566_EDAN010446 [Ephemera danica]
MKLCTSTEENCFIQIVRHCQPSFLDAALKLKPEAVDVRGPNGTTLPMLCDSVDKLQILINNGVNLSAVNNDGDTLLLHHVKFRVKNMIQNIIQSVRRVRPNRATVQEINDRKREVETCKSILECILNSGVDVYTLDSTGHSALGIVLKYFQAGFVINKYHFKEQSWDGEYTRRIHSPEIFKYEIDIASHALHHLLQAGAEIPPTDLDGITALMYAVRCPSNLRSVTLMIENGVDVNAVDQEGQNASFYLLKSFAKYCSYYHYYDDIEFVGGVDKTLSILLERGCPLQGTDYKLQYSRWQKFRAILFLMILKDSSTSKLEFPEKQALKNDRKASLLDVFMMFHEHYVGIDEDPNPMKLDLEYVASLQEEIHNGLDVTRVRKVPWFHGKRIKQWQMKLHAPYGLLRAMYMRLIYHNEEPEHFHPEDHKEYYLALDKLLSSLLPFWKFPPMALVIFCHIEDDIYETHVDQCLTFLKLLHEFGGPLTPGSALHHAARRTLTLAVQRNARFAEVLELFNEIHGEIPTLRQMSRAALRSNLTKVNTEGLDLSSLKVLFQEEFRSLPTFIRNYKNMY